MQTHPLRNIQQKLRTNFIENVTISIVGVLLGLVLGDLFKSYVNWFILATTFSILFFILYYRSVQKTGYMIDILDHVYMKAKGEIAFYDDREVFFREGQRIIMQAEKEILMYNDYFGQKVAVLGYNTPDSYFTELKDQISRLSRKVDGRFVLLLGIDEQAKIDISPKFAAFASSIAQIRSNSKSPYICNAQRVKDRPFYMSFTVVDGMCLRISIEGIYQGKDGPVSQVTGGFIIRDNDAIVKKFRDEFLAISRVAAPLESTSNAET